MVQESEPLMPGGTARPSPADGARPIVPLPPVRRPRFSVANALALGRWMVLRTRFPNLPRNLFYVGPGSFFEVGEASITFGQHVIFVGRLTFSIHADLRIGSNVIVNRDVSISCMESITIGDNCGIAEGTSIHDMTHCFGPEWSDVPFLERPFWTGPIVLGDSVWVGTKSTIVGGVTIGDDVVIGANSVVTKDIPSHCVAAGVPAKVIRSWA